MVVYDDMGGALAAVRVWWMLRWLGYENVAVLDGGWQHWIKQNLPVQGGVESRIAADLSRQKPRTGLVVSTEQVAAVTAGSRLAAVGCAWRRPLPRGKRNHRSGGRAYPRGYLSTLHGKFESGWHFPPGGTTAQIATKD